jgi:hypothetical protein
MMTMTRCCRTPCAFVVLAAATLLPWGGIGGQESTATLVVFQREVVQRLTGGEEIAPGVRLQERSTPESRAISADYLAGVLEGLGLEAHRQPYEGRRGPGENVYSLLPSTTGGEEYVVVGAHYDGVGPRPGGAIDMGTPFPAANDNGTGCAAVLGVARYLASLETQGS